MSLPMISLTSTRVILGSGGRAKERKVRTALSMRSTWERTSSNTARFGSAGLNVLLQHLDHARNARQRVLDLMRECRPPSRRWTPGGRPRFICS